MLPHSQRVVVALLLAKRDPIALDWGNSTFTSGLVKVAGVFGFWFKLAAFSSKVHDRARENISKSGRG